MPMSSSPPRDLEWKPTPAQYRVGVSAEFGAELTFFDGGGTGGAGARSWPIRLSFSEPDFCDSATYQCWIFWGYENDPAGFYGFAAFPAPDRKAAERGCAAAAAALLSLPAEAVVADPGRVRRFVGSSGLTAATE